MAWINVFRFSWPTNVASYGSREGNEEEEEEGVVVCVRACLCDLFTSGASVVRGEEVAVISVSELRVPISFWTNGGTRWTRIRGDASLVSLPEFPDG